MSEKTRLGNDVCSSIVDQYTIRAWMSLSVARKKDVGVIETWGNESLDKNLTAGLGVRGMRVRLGASEMLIGRNLQNLWYIHTAGRALTAVLQLVGISLKKFPSRLLSNQKQWRKEGVVLWVLMWAGCIQTSCYEFSYGCHWILLLFCSCAPHLLWVEASKLEEIVPFLFFFFFNFELFGPCEH